LLQYAMNGRETLRQGNRDDSAAPQGVYRCQGEDEWVSISVGSQEEWRGFVEAMDSPQWAEGDKFGDAFRRWKHHDELDVLIQEWTAKHTPNEVTEKLQSHKVPSFPSLSPSQLRADLHLEARGAFPTITHPEKGEMRAVVPPWRFSETPSRIDRWTPDLGEHNMDVFHGILGLPRSEVETLEAAQVIW
jgi:crotonobetainyl-CoA:carnitine CoA-transferase CaiB-like acyl-CoA transferase